MKLDKLLEQEFILTCIYQNDSTEVNWNNLVEIRNQGKQLEAFYDKSLSANDGSAVEIDS